MRVSTLFAVATLAAAAALPAQATVFTFFTAMTGAAEAPSNASPGTGTATVTFNDVAGTVQVAETWTGLLGNVNNNHIHIATTAGGTGNVALGFGTVPATSSGTFSGTFTPANFTTLLTGANAGLAYVNLHSTAFGGGEIRGFQAPVPEPESYALMLGGQAFVRFSARRRKVR